MAKHKQNTPEEDLQRTVAQYLDLMAKMHSFWWSHIAHGGRRTKAEAGIFKAMGLKPGIADILILAPVEGGLWAQAHWIELKASGRKQSDNQIDFQDTMEGLGCPYCVCDTLEGVIVALECWGLV